MPANPTVPCPGCRRALNVPEGIPGRSVRCPLCQTDFAVRRDGSAWVTEAPSPPLPALPPTMQAALPVEEGAEVPPRLPETPRRSAPRDSELEPLPLPATPRATPRPSPPGSSAPVRFDVRIEYDPDERLEGDFHAEVDAQGLHLWRDKGRSLHARRGAGARHLGRDRIRIFLDGRWVQIRIRTRRSAAFARDVVDYLNGKTQTLAPPGRELPLSLLFLLPLAMIGLAAPLFGWRGMLLVTPLAGVLAGMSALLLYGVPASRGFRALLVAVLNLGLGGAILLTLWLLQDRPDAQTPPHLWGIVPRHDQGFLVQIPGVAQTLDDQRLECFAPARAGALMVRVGERRFRVFFGEFSPPLDGPGQPTREAKWGEIERALERFFGPVRRTDVRHDNPVQRQTYFARLGNFETHIRVHLVRQRAVILVAQGTPNADTERFLGSLQLLGDDWLRPIALAAQAPPPGDARMLAPEARLLHDPDGDYLWAAFHTPGRVVGMHAKRGLVDLERGSPRSDWPTTPGSPTVVCAPGGPIIVVRGVARDGQAPALERLPGVLPVFQLSEAGFINRGALALSADGKRLAVGLEGGKVQLWDTEPRRRERVFEGFALPVVRVALAPRGDVLAVALSDGSLSVLPTNPARTERLPTHTRHEDGGPDGPAATRGNAFRVAALTFAPDGARLLSVGRDRTARLHHARNGRLLFQVALPSVPTAAAFLPSGRLFVVGAADGVVRVYDSLTGKLRAHLRDRRDGGGEAGLIRHLAFSPSGDALLVVTPRGIENWDFARAVRPSAAERQPLPFNLLDGYLPGRVLRMAGSRERIVALLDDRGIHTFKTPELERVGDPFRLPDARPADLLVTPDGKRCLVRSGLKLELIDLVAQRVLAAWADVDAARLTAMTPEGDLVASIHGGRLRLWKVSQTKTPPLWRSMPDGEAIQALALHPAGERLAVAHRTDARIAWIDPRTGSALGHLVGHTAPVGHLALSPDGETLASFAADRTLRLWDTRTLRERGRLGVPSTRLGAEAWLQFGADSRTLFLAQSDFSVVVDVPSARCLHTLATPHCLGVALDGERRLYIAMTDRPLQVENLRGPPYRDRPPPRPQPLADAAAPLPADLVPQSLEPHLALVGDREKGTALGFTRDRLLVRLDLPALQTRDVFWTGQIVYRAALDPARGLLLAATVDLDRLETLDSPERARGPILVYEIRDLLAGKPVPPVLVPRGSLPLSGHFDAMLFGAEVAVVRERKDRECLLHVVEGKGLRLREPLKVPLDPNGPLALTPDGKTLIVCGTVAGRPGGALVRVDLATRRVTPVVELFRPVRDLAVTPHWLLVRTQPDPERGSLLFLDGQDRELARWKEETPYAQLLAVGTRLYGIVDRGRFTPRELAVGKVPPATRPVEVARPGETLELDPPFTAPAQVLAGQWIVASSGHAYRLREAGIAPTPRPAEAPPEPLKQIGERRFGRPGRIHALQRDDTDNLIVGLSTGAVLREERLTGQEIPLSKGEGFPLAFAVDQRRAVLLRDRGAEGVPSGGKIVPRLLGGDRIAVAPAGRLVYPGREGLTLAPLRGGGVPEVYPVPRPISTLDADPSGALACGDIRGTVRFLAPKRENFVRADGHEGEVRAILLADRGRRAYSAGVDGKVHGWDTLEGKRLRSFEGHTGPVTCLALSADDKWLAGGGLDGSVIVWERASGRKHLTLPGRPSEPIGGLVFRGEEWIVAAGARLVRYAGPR